jgi:hypothetical protein
MSLYQPKVKNVCFEFNEKINVLKAHSIMKGMNKTAIKNTFYDKDDWGEDEVYHYRKSTAYMNMVMKYLRTTLSSDPENNVFKRKYRYAKDMNRGRIYNEGMGMQTLQSNLKNYLCGEYYVDIDIVNCMPSIMLYVCEQNGWDCYCLKHYVEKRDEVLAQYNLTKNDIIVAMNTDHPRKRKDNMFFNNFIDEIKTNRIKIFELIQPLDITTKNIKNPVSSKVGHYLKFIENDILQQLIYFFKNKKEDICIIPIFDGANIENVDEIDFNDELLKEINEIFADMKYIKFIYKPIECDIELNLCDTEFLDYDRVKLEFEKDFFHIKHPFSYWRRSRDADGSYRDYQLTNSDFRNACEEYKIEDFNDKGELIVKSIYNRWLGDKNKRQYDTIDFMPYAKVNNTPSYIYNTFQGFNVSNIMKTHENYEAVNIDNFHELLSVLTNDIPDHTEYLKGYLAHMFQYPNQRTEQVIVFNGWTGTGKDSIYRLFKELMGVKYADISADMDDVFGQYNSILDSKIVMCINEAEAKQTLEFQEKIKNYATISHNKIKEKYEKGYNQTNYCRLFGFTNNTGAFNIQQNDRRIVIFKTGLRMVANVKDQEQRKRAIEFWTKYYSDIVNPDWLITVYKYLMDYDLSNWSLKNYPVSDEKKIMKAKNIQDIYHYIKYIYDEKEFNDFFIMKNKKSDDDDALHIIKFKHFFNNYKDWLIMNEKMPEYKIKEQKIKLDLGLCNNSFIADKRIKTIINGEKVDGRYCCFQFKRMVKFLDNFIFTDEDECEDMEEVEFVDASEETETLSEDSGLDAL